MKRMVCEMCGSNDLVKQDGVFVCQNCGTKYSIEEAKNLLVEVNGDIEIKAENVIVQGKNINSLVKRGLELLSPIKISGLENKSEAELEKIAHSIIEQDADNFYGRLFLIGAGDYTDENFEICSKTTDEEQIKKFVDFLAAAVDWKLKFTENISDDILHMQLEDGISIIAIRGLASLKEISQKNAYASSKFTDLKNKLEGNILNVIDTASNNFISFYFSKDSVGENSYEFQKLCELASNLNIFIEKFIDYVDKEKIQESCLKIFNVVNSNRTIIMENNAIYGKRLLQSCANLSGKTITESQLTEMTKVFISGLWASGKRMTATLYNDKIEISLEGKTSITVLIKDILLLNMTQVCHGVLCYDLVYKINSSSYTVLHFGYAMSNNESFYDCKPYNSLSSWSITNNVKTGHTNYKDGPNPFSNGYNGLTYVSTQPQMKKGGCYVATCVYGSYDCPQVWTLRRYRDFYLDEHWWGKAFIKCYYAISPKIVKLFGKTKWFKKFNKCILDKKVAKLNRKGYLDTKYDDKY